MRNMDPDAGAAACCAVIRDPEQAWSLDRLYAGDGGITAAGAANALSQNRGRVLTHLADRGVAPRSAARAVGAYAPQGMCARLTSVGCSEVRGQPADNRQAQTDEPEPCHDLLLGSTRQFIVMMQRRHPEDAATGELEADDLDDIGQALGHKDPADNGQHEDRPGQNRQSRERAPRPTPRSPCPP